MVNLLAKFEVCIFSRSRDIKGSQNMKSRSRDHGHALFWPIFHFFRVVSLTINLHAKFEVCIFSRSRDIRGSRNFKSISHDLGRVPF